MTDPFEQQALAIADKLATMTDAEVRRAYFEFPDDNADTDPWVEALALECRERGIDI